jgi:hypothetical protein
MTYSLCLFIIIIQSSYICHQSVTCTIISHSLWVTHSLTSTPSPPCDSFVPMVSPQYQPIDRLWPNIWYCAGPKGPRRPGLEPASESRGCAIAGGFTGEAHREEGMEGALNSAVRERKEKWKRVCMKGTRVKISGKRRGQTGSHTIMMCRVQRQLVKSCTDQNCPVLIKKACNWIFTH